MEVSARQKEHYELVLKNIRDLAEAYQKAADHHDLQDHTEGLQEQANILKAQVVIMEDNLKKVNQ